MTNEIRVPGPDKEGFRVHFMLNLSRNRVVIIFGEEINHLPMPPEIAWEFGRHVLFKCQDVEPHVTSMRRNPKIRVQVMDGQVLMETSTPVSELELEFDEARELVFRLCRFSARSIGKDLPEDFPLKE